MFSEVVTHKRDMSRMNDLCVASQMRDRASAHVHELDALRRHQLEMDRRQRQHTLEIGKLHEQHLEHDKQGLDRMHESGSAQVHVFSSCSGVCIFLLLD